MRVTLCVGCNSYDALPIEDLYGAEGDAQRMFEVLIADSFGGYSYEYSKLLLSPTLAEIREALRNLLSENGPIDTFTFYFAGHGSVKAGSFYMWGRDVAASSLSMTALSLSDVFRMIAEVTPTQTNIIVDACEGGGLINDLGVLLKADALGDAHTPGVTLFATSAQNEGAIEEDGAGCGTSALLDCIQGRDFVQDHSAALDLIEISKRVCSKLRASGQTPVVWGLNLSSAPRFCRNPFYSDTLSSIHTFVKDWTIKSEVDLSRNQYEELWSIYDSIESNWNPRSLANTVRPIFAELSDTPQVLASFALRLSSSLTQRAEASADQFRSAEVYAVLAVSLLPHLRAHEVIKVAEHIVDEVFKRLAVASKALNDALATNPFALLSAESPLPELYLLPIRVTKVLAWTALPPLFESESTQPINAAGALYAELLKRLLENYKFSITPVSDTQAAYWYVCLSALKKFGLISEAEEIFGIAFYGLVTNRGKLLHAYVTGEQVLDYILAVDSKDFSKVVSAIKRPNETLTVFLRLAPLFGLTEVVDESLWLLDDVSFSAYINSDSSSFGDQTMEGGENLAWGIGYDIFRTHELSKTWPMIEPPSTKLVQYLSIFAALLYPNRVPWQCFVADSIDDGNTLI
ncbi:caspase family protein [Janthinobacterium sp. PLB04]|uniref:Caspase family protein n=1 Tax=Janthinobacterium lividum TaxID=29581 RepID=A0AAJ4MNK4_9BURK|nr:MULTISPECIES: caspase family protein [Janthinobacterium]KAB0325104.1 caspase family protein [Janthinobacterium lividum]QSX94193.1 caspase family protein [Janthinobacterium lividum]UGQ33961.1 caspase family protein [Janthinobacterium sp. PLB04]